MRAIAARAPRSDARRNRDRLIRAGAEVLAEDGPAATVTDIARRAGLSDGSFFTYFSSKDDLIDVLVAERGDVLRALAQEQVRAAGSPGERLERYMYAAAAELAPHRLYLELPADADHVAVARLVRDAQEAGAIRPDITAADVHALLMLATLAAAPYLIGRPELWRRFVALAVASLRPDARRVLPA